MNRRTFMKTSAVGLLAPAALLQACGEDSSGGSAGATTIKQAAGGGADYLNMYVGQDADLFSKHGINAPYKTFSAAAEAANAVSGGLADLAAPVQLPVLTLIEQGTDVVVPAVVCVADEWHLVVKSDIRSPQDLNGKRIATTLGSGAQYAFDRYLAENDVDEAAVKLVNLTPADVVSALARGDVDGFVWLQPQPRQALDTMGDDAHILSDPAIASVYKTRLFLVMERAWAADNRSAVESYLKGLIDADGFIRESPDEAAEIGSKAMRIPAADLRRDWEDAETSWEVHLDDDAVESLEDVAEWLRADGKLGDDADVGGVIDPSYLKAVDPSLVRLSA